jgi:pyruvate dehydrogenase (quinone)
MPEQETVRRAEEDLEEGKSPSTAAGEFVKEEIEHIRACDLHPADFVAIARGAGIDAVQIDDPARCGQQLENALRGSGPVLIEAVVDPFTPPMPAKVKASQALRLAEALVRGEPNRGKISLTNARDRVRELV